MFQNSYQNGTYFDLLDLKNGQDKLKLLYKTANVPANNKVFDKDLKTFVLEFNTANAKIHLPKDEKKDLYLIQQFLVFQIYFFPGFSWNLELAISDLTKTKRRIMLSPATHKVQVKPFFVKSPCHNFGEGVWNNLVVDLYSFIEPFKGQTYRSLDSICISGHFKLRRVYTSSSEPLQCEGENESQEINLPKNYYFPPGVAYTTRVCKFASDYNEEVNSEATEPTVKNGPAGKGVKPRTGPMPSRLEKNESVKTEKQIRQHENRNLSKKKKDFLANTNGTEVRVRNRKQEASDNEYSEDNPSSNFSKDSKSVNKPKKGKPLTKTQQIPPKPRSTLEGYNVVPKKAVGKQVAKSKLNPWRSTKINAGYTDCSQLQGSKQEQERATETPQTTSMLKTKNFGSRFTDTKNMGFDKPSEQFSENEYVQLSQKFSTLTDGKFFKNELGINNQGEHKNEEDQIEENIEMETNSVHSSGDKKEKRVEIQRQQINESINDSLDGTDKQKMEKVEQIGRSSLYGFGQQLMRRFMHDIERPYSPPIGERELTQQSLTERHDAKEEVQLIYDPVLNCYYDHRTHTYYQLKN